MFELAAVYLSLNSDPDFSHRSPLQAGTANQTYMLREEDPLGFLKNTEKARYDFPEPRKPNHLSPTIKGHVIKKIPPLRTRTR